MCQPRGAVAGGLIQDLDNCSVMAVDCEDRRYCFQITTPNGKSYVTWAHVGGERGGTPPLPGLPARAPRGAAGSGKTVLRSLEAGTRDPCGIQPAFCRGPVRVCLWLRKDVTRV